MITKKTVTTTETTADGLTADELLHALPKLMGVGHTFVQSSGFTHFELVADKQTCEEYAERIEGIQCIMWELDELELGSFPGWRLQVYATE